MKLFDYIDAATCVKVFVPRHTHAVCIPEHLKQLADGWTCVNDATGVWQGTHDSLFVEPVRMYEVYTRKEPKSIWAVVRSMGRQYMHTNPQEQAFLATASGMRGHPQHQTYILQRTERTNYER